jgi:segregation and condensation protein A
MNENPDMQEHTAVAEDGVEAAFIVDEATDEVLRLHLDMFEGPFEVLLYLIKSQEIDIFDIPVVKITEQFLRFIELLRDENLEVTGDFLVLAATLIQIKSKMLLPAEADDEEDEDFEEEDPRLELVEKLLEYRKYRDIIAKLQFLAEEREKWFTRDAKPVLEPADDEEEEFLEVTLYDLTEAFRGVLRFITDDLVHTVEGEEHSVDEKIDYIQERVAREGSLGWTDLFKGCRSRVELVCCFLAILELCRMGRLRAQQHSSFTEIRLFAQAEAPG